MRDSVILAAGRNTRLKGLVPSYYKPLVIVNGRPLIVSLTQNLLRNCKAVVIVASPENCGMIVELLTANELMSPNVHVIIQPEARGPGEGLWRGLQCCKSERVVLVCGDNAIPGQDIDNVVLTDQAVEDHSLARHSVTTSVFKTFDTEEARRFTRVTEDQKRYVEGVEGGRWSDGYYRCWTGPLAFDRSFALERFSAEVLRYRPGDPEIKISGVFNVDDLDIRLVSGHSVDIGTSDALVENS